MKPRILIVLSNRNAPELSPITADTDILYTDKSSTEAVIKSGGIPIFLPGLESISDSDLDRVLESTDGVLLTGADTGVNPIYYGEQPTHIKDRIDDERDNVEIRIVKKAVKNNIPLLGLCKGAQLINVAMGGSLYQDLDSQNPEGFKHDLKKANRSNLTHKISLAKDSQLRKIFGKDDVLVNSSHQQAVKDLAPNLKIAGIAEDKIIEAFEGEKNFILGLQFHAELRYFDKSFADIFKTFIKYCTKRARL